MLRFYPRVRLLGAELHRWLKQKAAAVAVAVAVVEPVVDGELDAVVAFFVVGDDHPRTAAADAVHGEAFV